MNAELITEHDYINAIRSEAITIYIVPEDIKKSKSFLLGLIEPTTHSSIKSLFGYFQDDRDILLKMLKVSGSSLLLSYLTPELRDDEEIVLAAVKNPGFALQYASARLKDNYDIALAAVSHSQFALQHISERLKNEPEILLEAFKFHQSLHYFPNYLRNRFKGKSVEEIIKALELMLLHHKLEANLSIKPDANKKTKV